jgi:hypothetical protein
MKSLSCVCVTRVLVVYNCVCSALIASQQALHFFDVTSGKCLLQSNLPSPLVGVKIASSSSVIGYTFDKLLIWHLDGEKSARF